MNSLLNFATEIVLLKLFSFTFYLLKIFAVHIFFLDGDSGLSLCIWIMNLL